MDILKEPKADQGGEHGGASIGDKWQGNPGHRHQAHRHPNILKRLEREPGDNPHTDQSTKEVIGALGDQEGSPEEEPKEEEHEAASKESGLLPRNCKDEVGLLLGDKSAIGLRSIEQPSAQDSTRSDGDTSLAKLISALLWIRIGIYK